MFKKILVCVGIVVAIVTFSSWIYSVGKHNGEKTSDGSTAGKEESSKHNLLAKRIFIDEPNDPQINFTLLRNQIKDYYSKNNLSGSIYFEYLPTGTSIRVDGDSQQVAASLIKLPAAMEMYKANELGKLKIDDQVSLTSDMIDDAYGELYKKGPGYSLSLRDAARIMLQQSDNTALKAIAYNIRDRVPPEQTPFNYADIDIKQNDNLSVSISARSYSSLLKCLYFACYNNKDDSQEILQYLTESAFNTRIVAGISDKSIKVAHKIGNYTQDTQSDCGIVYYPKRNYILCVMLKGPDNEATSNRIADISKLSYDYINSLPR